MTHEFSEHELAELLEGTLPDEKREGVRAHLKECKECARRYLEVASWRQELSTAGERLRLSLELPEAEIGRMLAVTLERIQTRPAWNVSEGTVLLRFLLEPICGAGTVRAAIGAALNRSGAGENGQIAAAQWRVFVESLSETIASVAGSAAGRLVGLAGASVSVEHA